MVHNNRVLGIPGCQITRDLGMTLTRVVKQQLLVEPRADYRWVNLGAYQASHFKWLSNSPDWELVERWQNSSGSRCSTFLYRGHHLPKPRDRTDPSSCLTGMWAEGGGCCGTRSLGSFLTAADRDALLRRIRKARPVGPNGGIDCGRNGGYKSVRFAMKKRLLPVFLREYNRLRDVPPRLWPDRPEVNYQLISIPGFTRSSSQPYLLGTNTPDLAGV